jgi:hypothetical protein
VRNEKVREWKMIKKELMVEKLTAHEKRKKWVNLGT